MLNSEIEKLMINSEIEKLIILKENRELAENFMSNTSYKIIPDHNAFTEVMLEFSAMEIVPETPVEGSFYVGTLSRLYFRAD